MGPLLPTARSTLARPYISDGAFLAGLWLENIFS
jgi:hypothetical protein